MKVNFNKIKLSVFGVTALVANSKTVGLGKKGASKLAGAACKVGGVAVHAGEVVAAHTPERLKKPLRSVTASAAKRTKCWVKNTQVFVVGGVQAVKDSKNPPKPKVVVQSVVNSNRRSSKKKK